MIDRIIFRIEADICDRRGLRQAWDHIDESVRENIRAAWRKILEEEGVQDPVCPGGESVSDSSGSGSSSAVP